MKRSKELWIYHSWMYSRHDCLHREKYKSLLNTKQKETHQEGGQRPTESKEEKESENKTLFLGLKHSHRFDTMMYWRNQLKELGFR